MNPPDRHWIRRPATAAAAKVGVVLMPAGVGVLAGYAAGTLLPDTIGLVARLVITVAIGLLAALVTMRATRWLLPLSFLLRLDLLFPDELPNRFRVALRAGSISRLEPDADADAGSVAADVVALAARLATHDGRTRGHSERVRAYVDLIGAEMGLSAAEANRLRWAALLHDVGKVAVDTSILNKPSHLDDDQWKVIRRHPSVGAEMVKPLEGFIGPWIGAVADHHEQVDGSGYPAGKRGDEISLAGRITAVADAYDVMTAASRLYRSPKSPEEAQAELVACAGQQFDRQVVRAFLQIPQASLRRRSLFAAAAAAGVAGAATAIPVGGAHSMAQGAAAPDGALIPHGAESSSLAEGHGASPADGGGGLLDDD